jgi:methyltransferase family protein
VRRYPAAVLSAERRTVRKRREALAFRGADPRFSRALENALSIEGFSRPIELSLLYHLALLGRGPGEVVEIGSYLGRSTVVLAQALADSGGGRVVAVDPHKVLTAEPTVVFDDYHHPPVRAAIQPLNADGVLGGAQLIVGKMIAFAPKALASAVPAPPGAATLACMGDLGYALSFGGSRTTCPR